MPDAVVGGTVGPSGTSRVSDGTPTTAALGPAGEWLVSERLPRYEELAWRGQLFMARAVVTAPVIFSTAAGTGGPRIWNGSSKINVVPVAMGFGQTVSTTVAAALGLTGGTGQTVVPTATTAADNLINMFLGAGQPGANAYRVGTPSAAGSFFLPLADIDTGALTTGVGGFNWIELAGMMIVPPNGWVSVSASATATTFVGQIALIWAEVPV
jgi:hypothetical protein